MSRDDIKNENKLLKNIAANALELHKQKIRALEIITKFRKGEMSRTLQHFPVP